MRRLRATASSANACGAMTTTFRVEHFCTHIGRAALATILRCLSLETTKNCYEPSAGTVRSRVRADGAGA